jgi:hypothetical protein
MSWRGKVILYISYFHKHHGLLIHLGFLWTAMSLADIVALTSGLGLVHLIRTTASMSGQIWGLPFLIYLMDMVKVNKWIVWTVITLLLSYPNRMPPLSYS